MPCTPVLALIVAAVPANINHAREVADAYAAIALFLVPRCAHALSASSGWQPHARRGDGGKVCVERAPGTAYPKAFGLEAATRTPQSIVARRAAAGRQNPCGDGDTIYNGGGLNLLVVCP